MVDEDSLPSFVDVEFSKVIATMLVDRKLNFSPDFLAQLTQVSIDYFHNTIGCLQKYTELQRRHQPSKTDVALLLETKNIHPSDLYLQYEQSKKFSRRNTVDKINTLINTQLQQYQSEEIPLDDPSAPFFANQHYEITELVPKQFDRPAYIPLYLPDLPPDYTYQNTSSFMDQISDLKEIRLKLVEESRMTEKSLYALVDNDERKWRDNLEKEIDDDNDSVMSDGPGERESVCTEPEIGVDVKAGPNIEEKTNGPGFDVEAYARKRRIVQQRREARIERRRELRRQNVFLQAEKYFLAYATETPTEEDRLRFDKVVNDEFKKVISSVRKAEKRQEIKLAEVLAEKERRDREKHTDTIEFSFGGGHDILDSSDDDAEMGVFDEPREKEQIAQTKETEQTDEPKETEAVNEDSDDELEDVTEQSAAPVEQVEPAPMEISNMNPDFTSGFGEDVELDSDDFEDLDTNHEPTVTNPVNPEESDEDMVDV